MGSSVNPDENDETPTVLLQRLHHWRMAFFGVVILLAGMLSGAAATLLTLRHMGPVKPPPVETAVEQMLSRFDGPLHLTAEQRQQVEPILQKYMAKLHTIWAEGRTAIMEELRLMNQEMAVVLNEDQIRLWEHSLENLPGPIRHGPPLHAPGLGRGPAPGPGGWRGPPAGRGPFRVPPSRPPAVDANTVLHN